MKLVLMLYDGAINFLRKAIECAQRKDLRQKNLLMKRAGDIIMELNNSLNVEVGGEMAKRLRNLYFFMTRSLVQANVKNDVQKTEEVVKILVNLREGWQEAYNQVAGQTPLLHQGEAPFYERRGLRI
jgi:flagellar protein FliS